MWNDVLMFVLKITYITPFFNLIPSWLPFFSCTLTLAFLPDSQLFIEEADFLTVQQNANIFQISQW